MCPVCYYANMRYPAADYNICPCCGTEFENDDEEHTHAQLRAFWIAKGAKWFFREAPLFWNPWQQLAEANVVLPYVTTVFNGDYIDVSQQSKVMFYSPLAVPDAPPTGEYVDVALGIAA